MSAFDPPLTISWFPTASPRGEPAIGDPERTTWGCFADVFWWRREGAKDGPSLVPARFTLEPDGRHVRRLKRNLLARTAIAIDCETNKTTGEIPPALGAAVARLRTARWAAVIYTSHNHRAEAPRYRIVLPLSEEIAPDLPAVEVVADRLRLAGVLDRSKLGASSLFYLPSMPFDCCADQHAMEVLDGSALDAAVVREAAGALLAEREAEKERIAAAAHAEAAARREANIAAGFDPDDSLIERLRSRFDLEAVLLAHGYDKAGSKFRHPNSTSGSYGADIKAFGGIERVFSHNANDPLHANNLPAWCAGVTALDAVDVLIILDYGGDRKRALHDMAERYSLTRTKAWKAVAGLIFRLIREQAPQEKIETAAYAEGIHHGLAPSEVYAIACWVAAQYPNREAA